ncbi:MAG: DNA translocase FtsK 4TM domain-containing protein [Saprospiraceae bacterium]
MGKKKSNKPFWKKINLKDERWTKVLGLFTLFFSIILLFSMISYLFTWRYDQDKVLTFSSNIFFQKDLVVANTLGRLGAFLSHQVIYWSFGLPAFILVYVTLMYTWKWIRNAKYSLTLKTLNALWLMLYSSVLMESLLGRFAFPFGGAIGEWISFYLRNMLGLAGLLGLLLLVMAVLFFWNYNPDLSGIQIPSFQLAGGDGDNTKYNLRMRPFQNVFNFFRGGENPVQPIEPVIDAETETPLLPKRNSINLDFDDPIEETVFSEPVSELDVYKPQYADLKDLRNEPVLEFEDLKQVPIIDTDETLPLEISDYSNETTIPLEQITREDDAKTSDEKYANLQPYDPDSELSKFQLPTVDLLQDYTDQNFEIDRAELEANKDQIIETLMHYKIEITKIRATVGPTVTLYEIIPAPGVRISKIKNLEDDIALNLSALGIRIIAPIPGKGTIGIEVPNKKKQIVSLREVLISEKFQQSKMDLPIALGRTIANEVFVVDLAKMPHLLIAGATGQGKSVGINTILMSLLYKKHPSQVKLVLIDPKKVELFPYSKLENHFLAYLPDQDEPIVTETNKVIFTLNSLCIEMDTRYDLLKKAESRNIKEYNKKFTARQLNPEKGHRYLPFIILVIDEFADMIMTAGKEVELPIGRLAQLARAVGIHLIIATQRPSVNIITGVIKANFPARLAFKVSSKVDSRTILDTGGADQLIGSGDMLLSVGGDMIRLQCAFVDTPEVENVLNFIHNQRGFSTPYFLPEYTGEDGPTGAEKAVLEDLDDMLDEAGRLVVQNQHGSTSMIQRRLKLGYNRAGRIMDQLELLGIVGAGEGSKPREVLVQSEMELNRILERVRGGKEKDTLF